MFNNKRYLTKGISERIEICYQMIMWSMIDNLNVEKDYLQIFQLDWKNDVLTITHSQEQPFYKKVYKLPCQSAVKTEKVYVIDSEGYSTMLLAEEY